MVAWVRLWETARYVSGLDSEPQDSQARGEGVGPHQRNCIQRTAWQKLWAPKGSSQSPGTFSCIRTFPLSSWLLWPTVLSNEDSSVLQVTEPTFGQWINKAGSGQETLTAFHQLPLVRGETWYSPSLFVLGFHLTWVCTGLMYSVTTAESTCAPASSRRHCFVIIINNLWHSVFSPFLLQRSVVFKRDSDYLTNSTPSICDMCIFVYMCILVYLFIQKTEKRREDQ